MGVNCKAVVTGPEIGVMLEPLYTTGTGGSMSGRCGNIDTTSGVDECRGGVDMVDIVVNGGMSWKPVVTVVNGGMSWKPPATAAVVTAGATETGSTCTSSTICSARISAACAVSVEPEKI